MPARDGEARASDGCTLRYTLHPAPFPGAPRLALIHSLALDRSVWDGVVAALSGDAEILAYDCRGHGRSGPAEGSYTTALFAHDLAAVLDHAGWDAATVAGCSMGGCVAQHFAALYPARTQALGLIDTTAWYGPTASEDWRARADKARQDGLSAMIGFQVTRWFGDAFRAEQPDRVRHLADVFTVSALDSYVATCRMLGEADLRAFLPGLRMPVTVVVGEEDYATPPAMAEAIRAAVPGAVLTVLPAGRHLTPVEAPEAIATLLRQVLPAPSDKAPQRDRAASS